MKVTPLTRAVLRAYRMSKGKHGTRAMVREWIAALRYRKITDSTTDRSQQCAVICDPH